MKIYVASKRQEVGREAANALRTMGHEIVSTWHDEANYGGSIPKDVDSRAPIAQRCIDEMDLADALVLMTEPDRALVPGGKHFETGYAFAKGKRVYVVGEPENIFHFHRDVVRVATSKDLITALLVFACEGCKCGHPANDHFQCGCNTGCPGGCPACS